MIQSLYDYFSAREYLLLSLGVFSLLTFLISLLLIPWLIVRIPEAYFRGEKRADTPWKTRHRASRLLLLILKNLAGAVLILLGVTLLILPGQGLLTILAGIILVDFPCKFRFQRWLVQRKPILGPVNWLRRKHNVPPLMFD